MSSHANQICNIIPEERYHCEDERNLFFFCHKQRWLRPSERYTKVYAISVVKYEVCRMDCS